MTSTLTPTVIRVVAECQLFSDSEGTAWMTETLNEAMNNGTPDAISAFTVTGCHPGRFGIQLVTFTVDVPLSHFGFVSFDTAKVTATTLLNRIVGDTDVQVRWLEPRQ